MMDVKYSFIMPAYKAAFIKESIKSILNQSITDFELVVVDDNSPYDIKTIVDDINDDRIKYYRNNENIGGTDLVKQWNHCLDYAKGTWIILATDDDIYHPDFLKTADQLLDKFPQADIFRARIAAFRGCDISDISIVEPCMPEFTTNLEFFFSQYTFLFGGIPQYVFRKTALMKIGGFTYFPCAWGSDDITSLLLSDKGVVCSSNTLVYFRYSGQNISSEGKFEKEKVIAHYLKAEFTYNYINQHKDTQDSLDYIQTFFLQFFIRLFPYRIKHNLLIESYKLKIYERAQLIKVINEHTPYLSRRNKNIMKLRLFIKAKQ